MLQRQAYKMRRMSLGSRINQRREELGLDVPTLAAAVGVSCSAVYQWESGDTKGLKPENLIKTGKALQCRLEWLVFDTKPVERPVSLESMDPADRVAYQEYQRIKDEDEKAILRAACADPKLREGLVAFANLTQGHQEAMLVTMRNLADVGQAPEKLRRSGNS